MRFSSMSTAMAAAAFVVVGAFGTAASAQTSNPFVLATAQELNSDVVRTLASAELQSFPNGFFGLSEPITFQDSGAAITLNAFGKADPFATLVYGVTAISAPTIFTIIAGVPITPIDSPTAIRGAIFDSSLVDATGDGVGIFPTALPGGLSILGSDNVQRAFVTGPSSFGALTGADVGPVGTGTSQAYGPFFAPLPAGSYAAGPTGSFNFLYIAHSFLLSGSGDSAILIGNVDIVPVPEASTYAMLISGLVLVGFMARRRLR